MRRDLVEKARGGDRDAFAALAADSIGRLFNIAQLMLRDRDLADDAVQETLVLAWRDLRGLRDLDGFDAWLHRVLVRCVYREANRERRRSARTVQVREILQLPGYGARRRGSRHARSRLSPASPGPSRRARAPSLPRLLR